MEIKTIVIILIISFVVLKVLNKKFDLLDAYVVLLPFKSLNFEMGLSVYAFQIPILLFALKKGSLKRSFGKYASNNFYLIVFIFYVIASTIIVSNFFIDEYIKNEFFDTFLRGEGRYIAILIKFIVFDFGIIYLLYVGIKNKFKIERLIKMYLFALIALSLLGVLQVVLSIFIGDIFPSNYGTEGKVLNDFVDIAGSLPFARLTSLGGEPKNIGCSLTVGVTLLVFLSRQKITLFKFQKYIIWLFLICIIFSLSTSGFGLLLMLVAILFLTGAFKKSFWEFKKSYLLLVPILITFIIRFWSFLYGVFELRILDRTDELANEEVDKIIIKFLLAKPNWLVFGSGVGNIHNLAIPFLGDESFSNGLQNNIFMSRYGYIKLISENGFIGFALFIIAFSSLLIKLNASKSSDSLSKLFFYTLLTLIIFYFARSNYIISELTFVTGLSIASLSIKNRKITT